MADTVYYVIGLGDKALSIMNGITQKLVFAPINKADRKQQWCFEGGCIVNRAEDLAIGIIQDGEELNVRVLKDKKGESQKWLIHGNPGAIEAQNKSGLFLKASVAPELSFSTPADVFAIIAVEEYPITLVNHTLDVIYVSWANAPESEVTPKTSLPVGTSTFVYPKNANLVISDNHGNVLSSPYVVSKPDKLDFYPAERRTLIQLKNVDLFQGDGETGGNYSVTSLDEAKQIAESKFANNTKNAFTYSANRAHFKRFSGVIPKELKGAISCVYGSAVTSYISPDYDIIQIMNVDIDGGDIGCEAANSLDEAKKVMLNWLSNQKAVAAVYNPSLKSVVFKSLLHTTPKAVPDTGIVTFIHGEKA